MATRKPVGQPVVASGDAGGNPSVEGGNSDGDNVNLDVAGKTIDPAAARDGIGSGDDYTGGTNKDGTATRKRGRKPGSTSGPKTQTGPSADIGAIQATILSFHAMLAVKIPEMEITDVEAQRLAEGIARVEKYYPAVSAVISGRIADHVALVAAVTSVYGVRFAAIKVRKAKEAQNPGDVIDMTQQFRQRNQPQQTQTPAE